MKIQPTYWAVQLLSFVAWLTVGSISAHAAQQFSAGSFTWDNGVTPVWSAASGGPYIAPWTSGNDAVFEGAPGTVSIAASGATAHHLNFSTSGFLIQNNTLTLNGATPTITAGGGITATISSQISGGAGLTKAGGGTVTISNVANNYTGDTTVTGGILSAASLGTGQISIKNGATLEYTGPSISRVMFVNQAEPAGTINVTNAATNLTLTRSGGPNYQDLIKGGDGTITLANSTFQDGPNIQVDAGVVVLSGATAINVAFANVGYVTDVKPGATVKLGSNNGGQVYYDYSFHMSGGTFDVNGFNPANSRNTSVPAIDGSGTVTNAVAASTGTAVFGITSNKTFSGNMVDGAGAGKLAVTLAYGNSTWILSGANTYSGATTITNGTMQAGSTTAFSPNSAYTIAASKFLSLNGFNNTIGSLTGAGNVTLGGAATLSVGADNTSPAVFTGSMTGNGSLNKVGSGTLTLNLAGPVYYTGATTITDGVLRINTSSSLPGGIGTLGGTSNLRLNGGVLGLASGDFTRSLGATNAQVQFLAPGGGFAAYTADRNVNLGGAASGVTWNTGSFVPTGGALILGATTADRTLTFVNPIDFGAAARTVQVADGTAVVDAALTGQLTGASGGGLTKTGPGTLRVDAANTYSGDTNIVNGVLRVGSANNVLPNGSSAGNVVLSPASGSAFLDLFGFNETINGLSSSGAGASQVDNSQSASNVTLTVGDGDANGDFAGLITNTGANATLGLTKDGAGKQVLSGANSYTGATNVFAGTLIINGNQSAANGPVFVARPATLGGIGIVGGATNIQGTHSPGNSPGIQTFAGNLTYSGASPTVNWQLVGNTTMNMANPLAVFDTILVGGDLDFANPTALNLDFSSLGSLVDWSDPFWTSSHLGANGWLLYDVTGNTTNAGNLTIAPFNWLDGVGANFNAARPGSSFLLFQSANDIFLNYNYVAQNNGGGNPVPEPASLALWGVVGLTAAIFLRRRRK